MRQTFPNHAQLCHVWAAGTQSIGRAGNMSFADGVLYSYSTPVARIVTTADGTRVALFTSHSYSVSTGGQLSRARRAWRGNGPSFTVTSLGVSGGRHREPEGTAWGAVNHAANVAALAARYRETLNRFMRMQSKPYSHEEWLTEYRDATIDYAARFAVTDVPTFDVTADVARIDERFSRLEAKRADPRYSAKLTRARELREATKRRKLVDEQAERARTDAERIERFRNGEHLRYLSLPYALLRVKPNDSDTLQTSQGAEVPLSHARRLFSYVAYCRDRATPYQRNGHSIHVGHFTVDSIDAQGNLRAGCHSIQWEEIERFADSQGWNADDDANRVDDACHDGHPDEPTDVVAR